MATYKLICPWCHKTIAEGMNFHDAAKKVPPETQWVHSRAYCSRECLNEERAGEVTSPHPSASGSRRAR